MGEEERDPVAGGIWVCVLDGEGEVCEERRRGVRIRIVETDRCAVDDRAGARIGNAELSCESDDAVSEMGIAEEREVSNREGFECEIHIIGRY